MRLRNFAAALFVLVIVPAALAFGQSYIDEPGIPEFTTSFPVEHGFINIANGNLHLEIPIASYPQRGGKLKYNARLVYDSRFWTYNSNSNSGVAWNPNGVSGYPIPFGVGWRFVASEDIGTSNSAFSSKQCACIVKNVDGSCQQWAYSTTYSGFDFQSSDGTHHSVDRHYSYRRVVAAPRLTDRRLLKTIADTSS